MTCPDSFHSTNNRAAISYEEFIGRKKKKKKETFADWFLIACAPAIVGFALSKHVIRLRGTFRAWITTSEPLTCFIHLPSHTARLSGTCWKWIHQYVNHLSRLIFHRWLCVNKATQIQLWGYVLNYHWEIEKFGIFIGERCTRAKLNKNWVFYLAYNWKMWKSFLLSLR